MSDAQITHEPRVYERGSGYSYYGDLVTLHMGRTARGFYSADERMGRYATELVHEIDKSSPEGRRAERVLGQQRRSGDAQEHERRTKEAVQELRALSAGGGATASGSNGAVFVSPFFLMKEWAPFRGIERSFADQCHRTPLPPYGMNVYLPIFSTTTGAGQQTENSALAETSPSTELEGNEVKTIGGKQVISQQLFDRAVTGGATFDADLEQQLNQQLEQEVDLYTLNQAITNGSAVSGQTEYKTGKLYQDIALGREILTDTAGTRLRPTHFFTTSDFYSYATRQSTETEQRPIIEARFVPGFPLQSNTNVFDSEELPKWARFTGTILPGGLLWFTDDNIPAVGTTTKTQLIVSAPEVAIVLMEGEPVTRVFVETDANELKVVVVHYKYIAVITRHKAGTAVITSAAYTTTLK